MKNNGRKIERDIENPFDDIFICIGEKINPYLFKIGNIEVWKDFGYRSTHLMTVAGKQIVETYYGKPPVYSYFCGRSTGGQQALQEAQRYPDDYDGILSALPGHCRTPLHIYFLWNSQLMVSTRRGFLLGLLVHSRQLVTAEEDFGHL